MGRDNKTPSISSTIVIASLILLVLCPIVNSSEEYKSTVWERLYGLNILDPNDDEDGDGWTNIEEKIAGTDPLSSENFLYIKADRFLPQTSYIQWESVAGKNYKIEYLDDSKSSSWITYGDLVKGIGGTQMLALSNISEPVDRSSWRIIRVAEPVEKLITNQAILDHDTDGDGMPDLKEYFSGTDPFDEFSLPSFILDKADIFQLQFNSEKGKCYNLKSSEHLRQDQWLQVGGPIIGDGETISLNIRAPYIQSSFFRLSVTDIDSDGDGLTDWEENVLGYNPTLENSFLRPPSDYDRHLIHQDEMPTLSVNAPTPIAIYGMGRHAEFKITRRGNLYPQNVTYNVSGTALPGIDYRALSGQVKFQAGQMEASIEVIALEGTALSDVEVTLNVPESVNQTNNKISRSSVSIVRKRAISVKNFGAIGDGITDDTNAIQAALDALSSSNIYNTILFPSGTYRLNSYKNDSLSGVTQNRILALTGNGFLGRDIVLEGEVGSKLLSTVSPVRSHILEIRSSFRSLFVEGMQFEKDANRLSVPYHEEPNGADGISVIQTHSDEINGIILNNSKFINCHGAFRTYAPGYMIQGKLKTFKMTNCIVSNPWGANSSVHPKIWGGGQMVALQPWVQYAIYDGNVFDGGAQHSNDPIRNPHGFKKDGSHFGSPMNLEFINNLVHDTSAEAVYQLHSPHMGFTTEPMLLPQSGESATVKTSPPRMPFSPEQKIAIRGTFKGETRSISLTVLSYDENLQKLTVRNDDLNHFEISGTVLSDGNIYLQINDHGQVRIENNVFRGSVNKNTLGVGAGIVTDVLSIVRNNYIDGYRFNVLIYGNPRTPLTPGSRGTLIEDNIIVLPRSIEGDTSFIYGVQSWGPEEIIRNNIIFVPLSRKSIGIALRGENAIVENNTIISQEVIRNGYASSNRSVGIGVGNTSMNASIRHNTTYGFDIGVGPADKYQIIPHYVTDHRSIRDELAIDPRGVISE